mmetsp:Transcript_44601/g.126165  ORF Transcript_44601/g.126165 Transcript_44601/m.126165 type:complete len:206 (-) Transcript_44601:1610-2227(-)
MAGVIHIVVCAASLSAGEPRAPGGASEQIAALHGASPAPHPPRTVHPYEQVPASAGPGSAPRLPRVPVALADFLKSHMPSRDRPWGSEQGKNAATSGTRLPELMVNHAQTIHAGILHHPSSAPVLPHEPAGLSGAPLLKLGFVTPAAPPALSAPRPSVTRRSCPPNFCLPPNFGGPRRAAWRVSSLNHCGRSCFASTRRCSRSGR